MSKNTLNLEEQNSAIASYLSGGHIATIAKQYNVTTKTIKDVVENRELRNNVEKKHIEITAARESRKIDEIKDKIFTFMSTSLDEALENEERKILFMDKVSKMISDLDRISRLNREQSTSNETIVKKDVKIDVAKIIKELKTPDDKKKFLRNQLNETVIEVQPE